MILHLKDSYKGTIGGIGSSTRKGRGACGLGFGMLDACGFRVCVSVEGSGSGREETAAESLRHWSGMCYGRSE